MRARESRRTSDVVRGQGGLRDRRRKRHGPARRAAHGRRRSEGGRRRHRRGGPRDDRRGAGHHPHPATRRDRQRRRPHHREGGRGPARADRPRLQRSGHHAHRAPDGAGHGDDPAHHGGRLQRSGPRRQGDPARHARARPRRPDQLRVDRGLGPDPALRRLQRRQVRRRGLQRGAVPREPGPRRPHPRGLSAARWTRRSSIRPSRSPRSWSRASRSRRRRCSTPSSATLDRGRPFCFPDTPTKLAWILRRFAPGLVWSWVHRIEGR